MAGSPCSSNEWSQCADDLTRSIQGLSNEQFVQHSCIDVLVLTNIFFVSGEHLFDSKWQWSWKMRGGPSSILFWERWSTRVNTVCRFGNGSPSPMQVDSRWPLNLVSWYKNYNVFLAVLIMFKCLYLDVATERGHWILLLSGMLLFDHVPRIYLKQGQPLFFFIVEINLNTG